VESGCVHDDWLAAEVEDLDQSAGVTNRPDHEKVAVAGALHER
jgi:hypothetical protein